MCRYTKNARQGPIGATALFVVEIGKNAAWDERYDKGWALLREDMAKRDRDNLRWQIGLWIAAVVILEFLIRL